MPANSSAAPSIAGDRPAATPAKDAAIRWRMLVGTLSNGAGKVITLAAWLFLTPFLLHHLGASQYGLWVLVGSLASYGSLLDLGMAGAVTKYVAEYVAQGQTGKAHALVATSLRLYVTMGVVALLLAAVLAPLFPILFGVPADQRAAAAWLVVLMGLSVCLSFPAATVVAVLRGLQRFDVANLVTTGTALLSALFTVLAVLAEGGVAGVIAATLPATLLMQAVGVWFIRRVAPDLRFGWSGAQRDLVRSVAGYSWPLLVTQMTFRLESRTDEIVIGSALPLSAVTPYALARKLSELPQILTDQFVKVILPVASSLHAESDLGRLRALYLAATRLTLAIYVPVGALLIAFAAPLLRLWVGEAYAGSAFLVLLLTIAGLIATSQWPAGFILQGMARHRTLALLGACSGIANLLLSLVLVRRFGVTGVAIGTLLPTTVVYLGLIFPYALRVIGVSFRQTLREVFIPALGPAVPMVLTLVALQRALDPQTLPAVVLAGGAAGVVYAVAYLSLGAGAVERETCRSAVDATLRLAGLQLRRAA